MKDPDKDIKYNKSGYYDPTAYEAIKNVERNENDLDERRLNTLLKLIFGICDLSGFRIEERIVLRDLKTGKIYR